MGWDINIGMRFEKPLPPAQRCIQLLDFLSADSRFATIDRFCILKTTDRVAEFTLRWALMKQDSGWLAEASGYQKETVARQ